jgi:hypothetical protein
MTNKLERKIQFGKYTKRDYREVRRLLKNKWKEEELELSTVPYLPSKKDGSIIE